MTVSEQPAAAAADGFPVDASTKYKLDAGQCKACGYYKTWGFKVQNTKSGKMMPGHVTAEGFKIGEGDCPKWAKIADMNKKKAASGITAPPAPPQPGAWIQEITGGTGAASSVNSPAFASGAAPAMPSGQPTGVLERAPPQQAAPAAGSNASGHVVAFTVNGFPVTTTIAEGMAIIEQISACVRKALGTGA